MNVNAKTKLSKAKKYMSDHAPEIATVAFFTAASAGIIALTYFSYKWEEEEIAADNKYRREMNDWMNDLRAQGTAIYRLADDRVLTVDKNGIQQTHLV